MKIQAGVSIERGVFRLNKLPDDVRTALKTEIVGLAAKLQDRVRGNFGGLFQERTGDLMKALKKSVRSNKKGVIGRVYFKADQAFIAHILEVGAKPHLIEAKNAKALAFIASGGATVEIKSVQHPGITGHSFFSAAWQSMKPEIKDGVVMAMKQGIKDNAAAAGVS